MKRAYFIASVGLVLLAFAALGFRSREPTYRGKRCRVWLAALDEPATRAEATNAIQAMGASALPYYVAELRAKDSPWKVKVLNFAAKRLGINLRLTPDSFRRSRAVEACALLGQSARPAIAALGVALKHGTSSAVNALERFGTESVPVLSDALTNAPNCLPPYATAEALGQMGASARASVTNLLWNFQRHPIAAPAAAAAKALARISLDLIEKEHQPDAPEVNLIKAELIRGLSDTNPSRISAAVRAVGLLQSHAKDAVPPLITLLNSPNPWIREGATNALEAIDPCALRVAGVTAVK